jgi:hypothetical protein
MAALEQLTGISQTGLMPGEEAALRQARRGAAAESQAKSAQLLDEFARRGMGGSGAELAARLQAGQAGSERLGEESDRLMQMAQQRALEAIGQSSGLAGNIRQQSFGEQSDVARAKDVINQFNTQNRQSVQQRNINASNTAALRNLQEKQRIGEAVVDVRVPKGNLLGELHRGFYATQTELPRERLTVAAGAVAACEGVLAWTVEYVRERKAFGQRLADFQNTQFKLAEYATDTRVHRAFYEECVAKCLRGELDTATASMAKLACTEAQARVVDGCLQLFGGYGYMTEFPVSRAYVDARIQRIYAGTSEIMKLIIARDLLRA